jgi:zinc-finger of transposase IS204/IS1001/IS1096/IS1165
MVKAGGNTRVYFGTNVVDSPIQIPPQDLLAQKLKTIGLEDEISHPETPLGQDGVTRLHQNRECPRMRIQTILNRVEKFKSFVYGEGSIEEYEDGPAIVIQMKPRKNSRVFCSGCGRPGRAYDRLEERRFEFVPIWGILVFLVYRMRRVDCKRCGVTVEMVPWCHGAMARTN